MSCENACYEAVIESCNNIVVRAGFPANFPLYWIIAKAWSNNKYQRLTTTNIDGDLLIPKADLPAGYLIKGNDYKIQVKSGNDYLQPVTFLFGGSQYNCINAELVSFDRDTNDNSEVNVIEFKESVIAGMSPASPNSIVYPFADETSFTYTHDLGRIVDVTVYNLAGELLYPTVTEDTVNHNYVTITFGSPTTGRLLIQ